MVSYLLDECKVYVTIDKEPNEGTMVILTIDLPDGSTVKLTNAGWLAMKSLNEFVKKRNEIKEID